MFVTVLLICINTFVGIWDYRQNLDSLTNDIETGLAHLKKSYGITIHFRYDHRSVPPFIATQTSLSRIKTTLGIVESFLASYPPSVVSENLSEIYLAGKLEFGGTSYGGSYKESSIFVAIGAGYLGPDESSVLDTLHHEFSSILFHKYRFPTNLWAMINGPEWKYLGSGFDMLNRKDLHDQTEDILRAGFLTKYAQSSLEEDVNTFAAWSFTKPRELSKLASKYKKIKQKRELLATFYQSIDSQINILSADRVERENDPTAVDHGTLGARAIGFIVALMGYTMFVIAAVVLHVKFRRVSTAVIVVGSFGALLGWPLGLAGLTTGYFVAWNWLLQAIGLLWFAVELKKPDL